MPATNRVRALFARQVSAATVATALSATLTLASAAEIDAPKASPTKAIQAPIVAIPTDKSVDGVPVYSLPPITVTVSRRAEFAKIEQGRAAVDLQQARTRIAAKRPYSATRSRIPAIPPRTASASTPASPVSSQSQMPP